MSRREFNKLETQRHIKNTFLEIYKQKGIDNISVSEICANADIAKSTFYLHFDDKYSVLEAIENELLTGLEKINEKVSEHSEEWMLRNVPLEEVPNTVDYVKEHIDELRAIMGPKGDTSFEPRWRQRINEKFLEVFKKEKRDTQDARLACTLFVAMLLGLYRHLIFSEPDLPKEKISKITGDTLKLILTYFDR